MWNDIETTDDLLNYSVIAQTAAQLIKDSNPIPLSIGVSGNWGTGKSSLVKMIGQTLSESDPENERFVFLEFNAWLYQGYEDARLALLQSVSDCISLESEKRKSGVEKAKEFAKRINWLRLGKLLAPAATGAVLGGTIAGPFGAVIGAANGLLQKGEDATDDDYNKVAEACENIAPNVTGLLKEKEATSLPKEIDDLRRAFGELLKEMNITLVVLVDDLDRCLPHTAISTLEAMRLLLLLPRTAFIIAADEEMIRHAVRHHFSGVDISDDLVTSYFDKLIQIPLRVPRLGHAEVKGYLILLFAELEKRRGNLAESNFIDAKKAVLSSVKESWGSGLTRKSMIEAFKESSTMIPLISIADQIAAILTTANQIAGNPRLIKRFLNDLSIRSTIASAEGISLEYEALMKLLLFERCAPTAAFEFLISEAAKDDDGKPQFLSQLETSLASGGNYEAPNEGWKDPFVERWVGLDPPLSETDLRPILNLSRTQISATVSYDKLSPQAIEVLESLVDIGRIEPLVVQKLKELGRTESEQVLARLTRKAREEQFSNESILRAMNITQAHPELTDSVISLLSEIPPKARKASLIPRLKNEQWTAPILEAWSQDKETPTQVVKAINAD